VSPGVGDVVAVKDRARAGSSNLHRANDEFEARIVTRQCKPKFVSRASISYIGMLKRWIALLITCSLTGTAQLRVDSSHRYFEENGKPWFWLGDTCWPLAASYTAQEAEQYAAWPDALLLFRRL
jgi:hypothetical protein